MALPSTANEFLNTLFNKVLVSLTVAQLELTNPYKPLIKGAAGGGDSEEFISIGLLTIYDYGAAEVTNFGDYKPDTKVSYIKTEDKKVVPLTTNQNILAAVFSTSTGLSSFLNRAFTAQAQTMENFRIDTIKADLKAKVTKTFAIAPITAASTKAEVENYVLALMDFAHLLSLVAVTYTTNGEKAAAPVKTLNLHLHYKLLNIINVRLLSDARNESRLLLETVFSNVLPHYDDTVVGYVLQNNAYIYKQRIQTVETKMNSALMTVNTFNHMWAKRGIVESMIAVKLVDLV